MVFDVRRAAMISLLLFFVADTAYAQQPDLLPLDPLTPQEREMARDLAGKNLRIRELLNSGRSREIYIEFIAVKRTDGTEVQHDQPSHRHAEVLYYQYDKNLGIRALVDLEARAVHDVVHVNGKSVPINTAEIEEAASLALADTHVLQLFGGKMPQFNVATHPATAEDLGTNRIEGLRTLGTSPKDPCFRHRCIGLFFRTENHYVQMNRVVVDLTSQKVLTTGGER